jgi:sugar phosphate isomerase/epimerase
MHVQVDRRNFGLTIDFGHCLMAGENPAQSLVLCPKDRLFGVQLGDGYGRLGAEDGKYSVFGGGWGQMKI